jgi:glutaredoxin
MRGPRSALAARPLPWLLLALPFALALLLSTWAAAAPSTAPMPAEPGVLQVFVREGCPYCAKAEEFLTQLARERPALRIVYRRVDADPQALADLLALSERAGISPPGVPTFAIDGRVRVGFADAQRSGPAVIALLDPTAARSESAAAPVDTVETPLFGTLSAGRIGLPLFTLIVGWLDGFNPCAMWVLLFLLSLLARPQDRRRMALVSATFVLASGAVYFAFMAAWLNLFLIVGWSERLRWLLAGAAFLIGALNVKDYLAWGTGPSLSIPAAAKPGLYARMRTVVRAPTMPASLIAVAALAVAVNFVELLCTAGFPAIYTAVLTRQQLSPFAYYAYLGLYILAYVANYVAIVVIAVVALSHRRLSEHAGRWLKLLSGVVMLAFAAVIVLRPHWLM